MASLLNQISSINICDVWLKCGGPGFKKVSGELRAINILRNEAKPSLAYIPKWNVLFDNAEMYRNKQGRNYRHADIVIAFNKARGYKEAILWLADEFGLDIDSLESTEKALEKAKEMYDLLAVCVDNMKNHLLTLSSYPELSAFFKQRGWSPDQGFFELIKVGLLPNKKVVSSYIKGFPYTKEKDYDANKANKILVFPLTDQDHNLVNFLLRDIQKKDFKMTNFNKKTRGFFQIMDHRSTDTTIVIVEGEGNLIALADAHWRAGVSPGPMVAVGSSKTKMSDLLGLKDKMAKHNINSAFVMQDNDEAGENVVNRIYSHVTQDLRTLLWPAGSTPKFDPEDQLKTMGFVLKDFMKFASDNTVDYVDFCFKKKISPLKAKIATKNKLYHETVRVALEVGRGLVSERDKRIWSGKIEDLINEDIFYRIDRPPSMNYGNITAKDNRMIRISIDPVSGAPSQESISNFVCEITHERAMLNTQANTIYRDLVVKTVVVPGKRVADVYIPIDALTDPKAFYNALLHKIGGQLSLDQKELRQGNSWVEFTQNTSIPRQIMVAPNLGAQDQTLLPLPPKIGDEENVIINNEFSVIGETLSKNLKIDVDTDNPTFDNFMKKYCFQESTVEEQKEIIRTIFDEVRNVHEKPLVDAIFGFLLASPIKYLFRKVPGMNVGSGGLSMILHGKSGIGKTAALALGMALFGKFTGGNLPAFRGTDAHREYILSRVGTLPVGIDEYRSDPAIGYKDINNAILDLYNGSSKGRMNRDMGAQTRMKLRTHAVFTTEFLPEGYEGENARFIDIGFHKYKNFEKPGFGGDIIDRFSEWMCENGSKLTGYYLSWVIKNPNLLVKETKRILDVFYKQTKKAKNGHRVSCNAAQCVAAQHLFFLFGEHLGELSMKEVETALKDNLKYWAKNLNVQVSRIESSSTVDKIVSYIENIISFKQSSTAIYHPTDENGNSGHWELNKNYLLLMVKSQVLHGSEFKEAWVFDPAILAREIAKEKISSSITKDIVIKELTEAGKLKNAGMKKIKMFWPDGKRAVYKALPYILTDDI